MEDHMGIPIDPLGHLPHDPVRYRDLVDHDRDGHLGHAEIPGDLLLSYAFLFERRLYVGRMHFSPLIESFPWKQTNLKFY